jgi:hypothetical protein
VREDLPLHKLALSNYCKTNYEKQRRRAQKNGTNELYTQYASAYESRDQQTTGVK